MVQVEGLELHQALEGVRGNVGGLVGPQIQGLQLDQALEGVRGVGELVGPQIQGLELRQAFEGSWVNVAQFVAVEVDRPELRISSDGSPQCGCPPRSIAMSARRICRPEGVPPRLAGAPALRDVVLASPVAG